MSVNYAEKYYFVIPVTQTISKLCILDKTIASLYLNI